MRSVLRGPAIAKDLTPTRHPLMAIPVLLGLLEVRVFLRTPMLRVVPITRARALGLRRTLALRSMVMLSVWWRG